MQSTGIIGTERTAGVTGTTGVAGVTGTTGATGGYDCSFISDIPDDLVCVICLHPAREAQQTSCSCARLLCFTCLQKLRSESGTCPTCRKPIPRHHQHSTYQGHEGEVQ